MSTATLADHSGIEWASETFDRMAHGTPTRSSHVELDRTRRNLEGTADDYVDESMPDDHHIPDDTNAAETAVSPFEATDSRTVGTCAVEASDGDVAIFSKPTARAAAEWDDWMNAKEDEPERDLTEAVAATLEAWAVSDDRTAEYWLSNYSRIDLMLVARQVKQGGNPQARRPD